MAASHTKTKHPHSSVHKTSNHKMHSKKATTTAAG